MSRRKFSWKALGVSTVWFFAFAFIGMVVSLGATAIYQHSTRPSASFDPSGTVFVVAMVISLCVAGGIAIFIYGVETRRNELPDDERMELTRQDAQRSSRARRGFMYMKFIFLILALALGTYRPWRTWSQPQLQSTSIKELVSQVEQDGQPHIITGTVTVLKDAPFEIFESGKPHTPQGQLILSDGSETLPIIFDKPIAPASLKAGDHVTVSVIRVVVRTGQGAAATSSVYQAVKIEIAIPLAHP